MSIKTSLGKWVRKGPAQAVVVVALVGLLIGALIGLGVGYKIEQSRTRNDVNRLRQQLKAKGGTTPATTGTFGQRVGKVTAVAPGSITVSTKLQGSREVATSTSTVFEKAVKGTIADVKVGTRLLVVTGGHEVLVLPAASKLGRVVAKVTSASISMDAGNGAPAAALKRSVVKTVSTVKPATSTDAAVGASVIAGGRKTTANTFDAVEVIVLLRGSAFAG
jgi:hypothetical protein